MAEISFPVGIAGTCHEQEQNGESISMKTGEGAYRYAATGG